VIVNSIFLKKPKRIEVLGLILVIALLIWRLMERCAPTSGKDEKRNQRLEKPSDQTTDLFYDDNEVFEHPGCKIGQAKAIGQAAKACSTGISTGDGESTS
jgi:hypothetical protein